MRDESGGGPAAEPRGLRAWLEHRTGLATLLRFARKEAEKPVPVRLSWLHTLGTLAAFFFVLQFATGFLMTMFYVPDERGAFASIQTLEHEVGYGWLVRQLHAWGASFIIIVLAFHILRVLWYGAYKRPREFTWFAGFILLSLTLAFCLSGCLLPWNQLAFWATRVSVEAVDSIPFIGGELKSFICGGPEVSGRTLGRFFALHVFLLPVALAAVAVFHLAMVDRHGITPRSTVAEERALGYRGVLARVGWETFFPRQVYRELLVLNLAFAALVTVAVFFPFEIGEPAGPQTPVGIKPEWYFLPMYQFLKYFDENVYGALPFLDAEVLKPEFLGVVTMGIVGTALFLLPLIDRGQNRQMRRRPFFALFALALLLGVVSLGILGYLSNRTVEFAGKKYRFTTKGYPEVVLADTDPGAEGEAATRASGDETAGAPATGQAAAPEAPPAAPVPTFRPDGLPPGGTCVAAGCHEEEREEWAKSIHFENQVECAGCHGGTDTQPPAPLPEALTPEVLAHASIALRKSDGEPRKPVRDEIPAFCGKCHQNVLKLFSPAHLGESPKKSCKNCHSNHLVLDAGDKTYDEGYTDAEDAKAKPFLATRALLRSLEEAVAASRLRLGELESIGYPLSRDPETREPEVVVRASAQLKALRPLVHGLDEAKVRKAAEPLQKRLADVEALVGGTQAARRGRWRVVACVWAAALFLSGLIALRLRAIGPEPQRPPEPQPPERDLEGDERAAEEREDLLRPLLPPAEGGAAE